MSGTPLKRDFITIPDFTRDELTGLFAIADRMKRGVHVGKPLKGKTLAMLFLKSSTRTRVSFEVGTHQLGGHALFLSDRDVQLGRGEPIADTARVLSRMVDGIMIRTYRHSDVEELAQHAGVPVMNGLTDLHHPCQVLADDGEILVANEAVMSEYWDAPQETAQAFDGDFYRTGDVGTLDPEGYLTIVGRKREIIRTGGESVAPVEVEALLRSYPGVADVAVFGVPDAQWGEVVCAAVVMGGDLAPPGVSHVRSFLEDKLAAYKHPRRILAVDAIPRTPATGQVKRALLRQTLTDGGTGGV